MTLPVSDCEIQSCQLLRDKDVHSLPQRILEPGSTYFHHSRRRGR